MKALTIHQPYASLIAIGGKRYETRGYPAPPAAIGQRIAIHAGMSGELLDVAMESPYVEFLQHGHREGRLALVDGELPLGVVLATALLVESIPMDDEFLRTLGAISFERTFGWFGPGRHAWSLSKINVLREPVPVRGMQRVWNLPDDVAAQVVANETRESVVPA